ncbi:unnamed protein product [Rhizoctonia solani]|uniref:Uncharacterized protein n=1 Tax=Rhizoctonia solani TaxID=456999 RepID=A0A8H3BXQ7_9AGAM|nr:unnamed protein product [Rhizoctonia solani]
MENKRAEKTDYALEKRMELEMKQLEEDRERRKRHWEIEDEDRKRRRLIEDEDRERRRLGNKANQAATHKQAQVKFFLELANNSVGESADTFRQHAMALAAAIAKETLESMSSSKGGNSGAPSADVRMQDNMRED